LIEVGHTTVHEYAKSREILAHHGSQFWSVCRGESAFDAYCHEKDIIHILGGIGKPTRLGKIEGWFRIYDQEHARFMLDRKLLEYYNYERPHTALFNPPQIYCNTVPNAMG
jgi:transposase InsO family protein